MKPFRFSLLLLSLLLNLDLEKAQGAYSIFVASQGAASRTVQVGEAFNLDVVLFSDVSDVHNSAILRLVFSAPGLFYDSYLWSPPYGNGTSEDDSKPLARQLPLLLNTNTLTGAGYPNGAVDLELSNVTSTQPGFGSGTLVRLTLSVPLDYAGPTNVTVTIRPESFANGFNNIPTVPSSSFTLTIVEIQSSIRTLVASKSIWRYLDNGSDQGSAWRAPGFDASSWSNGVAEFGYGHGDEATVVRYGPEPRNKHVTTFFRQTFVVPDASSYGADLLHLRARRADGIVAFLNGTEVFRDNMPAGAIAFDTLASNPAADDGYVWISGAVDQKLLINGTNLLAAEVHQIDRGSPDISFDLELSTEGCVSRKLTVLQGTNQVLLVLPCAADGYRVESADGLAPPVKWVTVTNQPVVSGSLKTLVLARPAGSRFFRLAKP